MSYMSELDIEKREEEPRIKVTWGGLMPLLITSLRNAPADKSHRGADAAETILISLGEWLDQEGHEAGW